MILDFGVGTHFHFCQGFGFYLKEFLHAPIWVGVFAQIQFDNIPIIRTTFCTLSALMRRI